MKLIAPDYYPEFHCIAQHCRHSCCIGWEIDIDEETLAEYREIGGDFGRRLNSAIEETDGVHRFRLAAGERCPMLNENGLCDLITALGEYHLCQICADHPRFRNFFSDRTEIGLGLCCEEAARLVLTQASPMQLIVLEDDGAPDTLPQEEAVIISLRALSISIMQDETLPLPDRLQRILDTAGITIPNRNWKQTFLSLERLDHAWNTVLAVLPDEKTDLSFTELPQSLSLMLAQFGAYLLFRHQPGALDDGLCAARIAFCVLAVRIMASLCAAQPSCTPEMLLDFARMFSAEIEYSEENMDALLNLLDAEI